MIFPENVALHGEVVDALFWLALLLTGIAFVLVAAILAGFLVAYRARPGHRAYYTHGTSRRALLVTAAVALLVFVFIDVNLAYHDEEAWQLFYGSPPRPEEAFVVQAMPQQFQWNFRYAGRDGRFGTGDDVTTINEIRVPVGVPVLVQLRARDTIHSFFVPVLRKKQDALPGLTTTLYFQATREGQWEAACAELCGLGHYRMRALFRVESAEAVRKWQDETQETYGADLETWRFWDRPEEKE